MTNRAAVSTVAPLDLVNVNLDIIFMGAKPTIKLNPRADYVAIKISRFTVGFLCARIFICATKYRSRVQDLITNQPLGHGTKLMS